MKLFTPVHVRFRDLDALGHVNNAVYHSYVEEARVAYFDKVVGTRHDWDAFGVLLARTEINYLKPIHFKEDITCGIEIISLGNTSIEVAFALFKKLNSDDMEEVCSGKNILVCRDHTTNSTAPIPADWKNAIEKFEDEEL